MLCLTQSYRLPGLPWNIAAWFPPVSTVVVLPSGALGILIWVPARSRVDAH